MKDLSLPNLESVQSSITNLSITAVALFLLPLVFVILWKKRCGKSVSLKPLLIGAIGFLVSVRVLELGVHMICIVMDNPISRFINGSTPAYVLYGIFMAGIFEECGRYIIIKYLMKKNKTKENFVMYGIGHGGIEVWSITLVSTISILAIALMIKNLGAQSTLQLLGVTKDAAESTVHSIINILTTAANFSLLTAGLSVFERICAMSAHIFLTIMVAYAVENRQKKYLPAAILAHAVLDLFPALYQRGAVSMAATQIWLLVCVVVVAIVSIKLYHEFTSQGTAFDSSEPQ